MGRDVGVDSCSCAYQHGRRAIGGLPRRPTPDPGRRADVRPQYRPPSRGERSRVEPFCRQRDRFPFPQGSHRGECRRGVAGRGDQQDPARAQQGGADRAARAGRRHCPPQRDRGRLQAALQTALGHHDRAAGLRVVLAARPSPPLPGALPRLRYSKVLPNYPGSIENVGARERAMEPVKFVALDRDDLEVVSTHLQDALVKVCDVIWRPQEKRVVVGLSRFDWLSAEGTKPELRRCRSALRFERVNCCKCRNVDPTGKAAVLNLLAVEFAETDPPAGVVSLIFSGGGTLRLEVECLEAELTDLGPSWPAAARPIHTDETPDLRG